jgi:hypothetical protein
MQVRKKVATSLQQFIHIIEVRRVGARGLMFNEIKYDHKK